MTLHEKIGQLLLLGWEVEPSPKRALLNAQSHALIDELHAGGVILMERNTDAPDILRASLQELQAQAAARGLPPLFVAIDQEGGRFTRLRPPHYRDSRDAHQIGRTQDTSASRTEAAMIGAALKDVGINWNFAPVLDVNNNPANPVIGDRSYGSDPMLVAAMGVAAIRGYQSDAGILACGKHFPGHGDTDVDSHRALPVIRHGLERLHEVEFVPFRAAIEAGVGAIMTAHILFPALDPELPATLSHRILTGVLRQELGFDGLIITDCLEMAGIADCWNVGDAAVRAVEAGADLLLCCHTLSVQRALRGALVSAVESGRISEARIDESLARIARVKARWASPGGSNSLDVAFQVIENHSLAGLRPNVLRT